MANQLTIKIGLDGSQFSGSVERIKGEVKGLRAVLTDQLKGISALEPLRTQLAETEKKLLAAREKAAGLRDEMQKSGPTTEKAVVALKHAELAVAELEAAYGKQSGALTRLETDLAQLGISSKNAGEAQARLKAQLESVTAAARERNRIAAARDILGVQDHGQIEREILKVEAAYKRLAASGTLTAKELTQANVAMRERVAELEKGTNGWVQSLGNAKVALAGTAVGILGLVGGLAESTRVYSAFATQMGAVQTIAGLSQGSLAALGKEIRQAAQDMGRSGAELAGGVYDLLSAGVAAGDAVPAIKLATQAAIGGMTDAKTASQVGMAVVNAYGYSVKELASVYDTLFATVRDGVTTFPELAAGIGGALPVARAAGIRFDELAAMLAVLTKNGLRTPIAVDAVKSAITNLTAATPEAQKRMRELGIATGDFMTVLNSIASKKLSSDVLREIIPDEQARVAVLSLASSYEALEAQVKTIGQSAGEAQKAYRVMEDTPAEKMAKFEATITELKTAIGELVVAGQPLLEIIKAVIGRFNDMPEAIKAGVVGLLGLATTAGIAAVAYGALRGPLSLLLADLLALNARYGLVSVSGAAAAAQTAIAGTAAAGAAGKVGLLGAALNLLKANPIILLVSALVAAGVALDNYLGKEEQAQDARLSAARETRTTLEALVEMQGKISAAAGADAGQYTAALAEIGRLYQAGTLSKEQALKAAREHTDRVLGLIKSEADAEFALAEKKKALSRGVLEAKLKDAESARKTAGEKLDEALGKEKEHAEALKRLGEERRTAAVASADQIRALRRRDMDETAQQADLQAEVDQKLAASAELVRDGKEESLKAAQDLAREAQSLAGGIASTGEAVKRVESAGKIIDDVKAKEIEAAAAAQETQRTAAEAFRAEVDENTRKIEAFHAALEKIDPAKQVLLSAEVSDAESNLKRIRGELEALRDKTVTVTVYQQTVSGGATDAETPAYAGGGPVRGPGSGTSDSILARLSNGEYIVRQAAAQRVGYGVLDYINRLGSLPRFADGGRVGQGSASAPTSAIVIENITLSGIANARQFISELKQLLRTDPHLLSTTPGRAG